jgi:HEAT repeat protein
VHNVLRLLVPLALAVAGCSAKPDEPLRAGGHTVAHWLDELKKPDPKARKKAVKELGHVGRADPDAIPAVTGALRDADAGVRAEAALALLNLGPDAAEAAPALSEATRDKDPKVREFAAKALDRVRAPR